MTTTIDDLCQCGDLSRSDLQQFAHVTAYELYWVFGADYDDIIACRQGRLSTIAKTDTTVTQADYDAFSGRFNVQHWVG